MWLRSLDLHERVLGALSAGLPPGSDELAFVLGLSDAELTDLLRSVGGELASDVRDGITELLRQDEHTAKEWNDKWVASKDCFTIDYGSLDTYYGGLEALIGLPDVRIHQTMLEEHTQVRKCAIARDPPSCNRSTAYHESLQPSCQRCVLPLLR